MADRRICSIEGCGKPVQTRGWCNAHYLRWHRHGDPLAGGTSLSEAGEPLKWMRNHLTYEKEDCLIWPFARHTNGYGSMRDEGRQVNAHRWVCEQVHGAPPTSAHQAAHSCGMGGNGCVNPRHLRWATPAQNTADKFEHGTMPFGNRYGAKLTEEGVRRIRSLQGVMSQSRIGAMFGISQSHVGQIHRREIWGDLI